MESPGLRSWDRLNGDRVEGEVRIQDNHWVSDGGEYVDENITD